MANRTDSSAKTVHGSNPQLLIDKIVRLKIHSSTYWKEKCFSLDAESLIDEATALKFIGGTYGGARKPSPYLCLVLKMLQIQPDPEIVDAYVQNNDYKYLRALGAFYLRLVGSPEDIYEKLEPLYNDYRKLVFRNTDGSYHVTHVDEFVDDLLKKDIVCDIVLPRIPKRQILEENGEIKPRFSVLEEDLEEEIAMQEEAPNGGEDSNKNAMELEDGEDKRSSRSRGRSKSSSRSSSERKHKKKKEKKDKKHKKKRSRSRSKDKKDDWRYQLKKKQKERERAEREKAEAEKTKK